MYYKKKLTTFRQGLFPAVLILLGILLAPRDLYCQKLYIFLPGEHLAIHIESQLSEYFSGIQVRAFSTYRDFKTISENERPQGIITKREVVDYVKDFKVALQAQTNGSTTEPYYILSLGEPIQPSQISNTTIGIMDFLGRNEMKSLTVDLIGAEPLKISGVKKLEDLFSLITLDMVQGIIASENDYNFIKRQSKLDFKEARCKKSISIAVYAADSVNTEITERVKKMPKNLMAFLGFDSWK
jgi:hypothetical protein